MNYRILGRTNLSVSEIGFGGAGAGLRNYLGKWDPAQPEAAEQVVKKFANYLVGQDPLRILDHRSDTVIELQRVCRQVEVLQCDFVCVLFNHCGRFGS